MRARFVLILAALSLESCLVSFDGYELGSGGGGHSATGASGGTTSGGGGTGGTTAGSGGTSGTGATGATGGTAPGGGGTAGSGGGGGTSPNGGAAGTGGSGGMAGAAGSATGGTGATGPDCSTPPAMAKMVAVPAGAGSFCIDESEVTAGQYQTWLGTNPSTAGQTAGCGANTDFTPPASCLAFAVSTLPIRCVDWCDAYAYCKAVGKHLCGAIGGNPAPSASVNDASVDEWYAACSKDGANAYPYGPLYSKPTCTTADNASTPQDVESKAACITGWNGKIYDMSGNVEEWEDACDNGTNKCPARGGGCLSLDTDAACTAAPMYGRLSSDPTRGFRCCKY